MIGRDLARAVREDEGELGDGSRGAPPRAPDTRCRDLDCHV
jgi:hypothetical protein